MTPPSGAFVDVSNVSTASTYTPYAAAIQWMSVNHLSKGYTVSGGFEYRPANDITRGEIATFLNRAAFNLSAGE